MVGFRVSAVLPISAETFFVERDSAAFRSLVAKSMKLGALDIVEGWSEGEKEVYKFVTKPDLDKFVPKSLQKYLAKHGLQYTDIITYDPELIQRPPFRLPVRSIPPILPDKSRIECTLIIEDEVPGVTCRQTLEGLVEFRLPGLGKIAERIVVDSLHRVYSGIPAIVERWLVIRDEVLQEEGGRDILFSGRPDNTKVNWISDNIRAVLQAPYQTAAEESEGTAFSEDITVGRSIDADSNHDEGKNAGIVQGMTALQSLTRRSASAAETSYQGTLSTNLPAEICTNKGAGCAAAGCREEAGPGELEAEDIDQAEPANMYRSPVDLDGEIFYDTVGDWEESDWESSPAAEAAMSADREAATQWYQYAKLTGQQMPCIDLVASGRDSVESPAADTAEAKQTDGKRQYRTIIGRRFSAHFNRNQAAWADFWEDHKVPALPGVTVLGARLEHLLRLAAAWGYKRRFLRVQLNSRAHGLKSKLLGLRSHSRHQHHKQRRAWNVLRVRVRRPHKDLEEEEAVTEPETSTRRISP